jgi:hypothetical protein
MHRSLQLGLRPALHSRSAGIPRSGCGFAVSRPDHLLGELLSLFGGRAKLVMAHLVESGKLTLDDVQDAEKTLRKHSRKEKER